MRLCDYADAATRLCPIVYHRASIAHLASCCSYAISLSASQPHQLQASTSTLDFSHLIASHISTLISHILYLKYLMAHISWLISHGLYLISHIMNAFLFLANERLQPPIPTIAYDGEHSALLLHGELSALLLHEEPSTLLLHEEPSVLLLHCSSDLKHSSSITKSSCRCS